MDRLVELAIALGYKALKPGARPLLLLLAVQASLAKNDNSFSQRLEFLYSEIPVEEKVQHILNAEQKYRDKQPLTVKEKFWMDMRALCETLDLFQNQHNYLDVLCKMIPMVDFDAWFKITAPDNLAGVNGNPISTRYKATLCMTEQDGKQYFDALFAMCHQFNETICFMLMNDKGYHAVLLYSGKSWEFEFFCVDSESFFVNQKYMKGLKFHDGLLAFNLFALTAGNSKIPQDELMRCMQELKQSYTAIQQNQPVPKALFQLAITTADVALVRQICEEHEGVAQEALPNRQLPLHFSTMVAGVEMIDTLLAHGAHVLQPNAFDSYAISSAILVNNTAAIERLLLPSRSILSKANSDGMTPIMAALSIKHTDIAKRLFETALQPVTAAIASLAERDATKATSQTLQAMKQELTTDFTDLLATNGPLKVMHNTLMSIACQFGNMVEIIVNVEQTDAAKSNAIRAFLNHNDVKTWMASKDRASWSLFGASVFTSGLFGALSALVFPPVVVPVVIASALSNTSTQVASHVMHYFGLWSTTVESGAKTLEASYRG